MSARTSCRHEAIKTLLFFAHTSHNHCEFFSSSLYPNSISTSHETYRRFQSSSIYLTTHLYQEVTKRHLALGPLAARCIPLLPHRTPPSNYHILAPVVEFNTAMYKSSFLLPLLHVDEFVRLDVFTVIVSLRPTPLFNADPIWTLPMNIGRSFTLLCYYIIRCCGCASGWKL
jgi:hypothetical protein